MMKRMEDFGLSKKLKVPANYWRLDVCRIWLHKLTAGHMEHEYEALTGIPKSTVNKLFLYAELMVCNKHSDDFSSDRCAGGGVP